MTDSVHDEIQWRYTLLAEIGRKSANYAVHPTILRDWRIYGGQQGIWVDKQRTAAITDDGNGIAVGLLHKGNIISHPCCATGTPLDKNALRALRKCKL